LQQTRKDIANEKEANEKAKRVKEAQERRDRERLEKIARTNALVDMNNGKYVACWLSLLILGNLFVVKVSLRDTLNDG
jgi:hypothetical protein